MREEEALLTAERIRHAAESSTRKMTMIENALLQSLLQDRSAELYTVMKNIHDALAQGEKDAYLRSVSEYSRALAPVLTKYVELCIKPLLPELHNGVPIHYIKQVLNAVVSQAAAIETTRGARSELEYDMKVYTYSLTDRETEVLELIALGLSNKEVAEKLVLSEGTVKLHLHRIYGKLHANGRVQAIRKAKQLRLIP